MLTPKQEVFVQKIIEGLSQADAYRTAYSTKNMSDKTVHEAASRLMADSKVSARVKEIREKITTDTIMSAQKRLEWLTEQIGSKDVDVNAKLKAIDIMNKMQGEYIQKIAADVEVTKTTISIDLVDDEE